MSLRQILRVLPQTVMLPIIANLGSYESKPEIYVFDAFEGVNIMGNALYTSKVS